MTKLADVELLESAVRRYDGIWPPALAARHGSLSFAREALRWHALVGVAVGGALLGATLMGGAPGVLSLVVAAAGTFTTYALGFVAVRRLNLAARAAIARSALRAIERHQDLGSALGGHAASVGVPAALPPALRARAEQATPPRSRPRLRRSTDADAQPDRPAADFDDSP